MEDIVITEKSNQNTIDIDLKDSFDIVRLINEEDLKVAYAVKEILPEIASAVDLISQNFLNGGRLLYFGAGTSGRLGILDASECPPTFNTPKDIVKATIAGGDEAIKNAIEGAEDSVELAKEDFNNLNISQNDTVVCISASGNAKYVVEILKLAQNQNIKTIAITSNSKAKMKDYSTVYLCINTGAEVITGSTRMKAGTAQKMVLNMLTTASMIKTGKVYKNYMIDLNPSNIKLKKRAVRIIAQIAEVDEASAEKAFYESKEKIKHSILKLKYNIDFETAEKLIKDNQGILRKIFNSLDKN